MKSTLCLWIALLFTMSSGAIPAISDRAFRIPLQRRSRNTAADPMLVESGTSERSLGAQRAAQLISYARECVFGFLFIRFV